MEREQAVLKIGYSENNCFGIRNVISAIKNLIAALDNRIKENCQEPEQKKVLERRHNGPNGVSTFA